MEEHPPNANGPPDRDPDLRDDLLEEVARVAREDDMTESERMERLRRLAAGELSDAELAELREAAASSDEAALDLEAFSPLDDEFREGIVRRLQAETQPEARSQARSEARSEAPASGAEVVPIVRQPSGHRARQTPRPRRTRRWLALAASLLLAVSLYLFVQRPAPDMPVYVAELSAGIQTERGGDTGEAPDPDELPAFAPGTLFRAVFSPEEPHANDLDFDFYFTNADAELISWEGYERDGDAFKIERDAGELPLRPGVWTLSLVYGPRGRLPDPASADDLDAESRWWRKESVTFRLLADDAAAAGSASNELPLEVLYAGCAEVTPGPTCVPQEGLTLWVRSEPRAEITVRAGGRSLDDHDGTHRVQVDGGWQIAPKVTPADGEIVITAELDSRSSPPFHLRLAPSSLPDWFPEARKRWQEGETDGLRDELEARYQDADDALRGRIHFLLAYLPETSEAERTERLEEAVRLFRDSGQIRERYWTLGTLLHSDLNRRRFGSLRRRLEDATPVDPSHPAEARLVAGFYRGHLDSAVGNHRGALTHRREVAEIARRVNQTRFLAAAHTELAETLYLLGRVDEAERLFARTVSSEWFQELSDCYRANIFVSRSWTHLLAEGDPGEVLPSLERAEELTAQAGCDDPLPLNLRFNRALALHLDGRHFEARRQLVEIEGSMDGEVDGEVEGSTGGEVGRATTKQRLWWHEILGRVDLAEGNAESAVAHARKIEELSDVAFEPRGRWRALVLRAAALDALGATERALAAYAAAEELLDERSFEVPLDEGRGRFLADRQDAVRHHLDLLLRSGRDAEALAVARRSRSWELRSIRSGHRLASLTPQQQLAWDRQLQRYLELRRKAEATLDDDWRLAKNDLGTASSLRAEAEREAREALDLAFRRVGAESHGLPPLREGELTLAFHPLPVGPPEENWVAFGASADEIRPRRFRLTGADLGDDGLLTDILLEPFRPQIEAAHHIRILALGPLQSVDFHALPWNDDVLLAAKPVVYGLDLETSLETSPRSATANGELRALVVGDPRLDLPAARREAHLVRDVLADAGMAARLLLGSEAGLDEVRTRLPEVDHFHFAGHSVAGAEGADPWSSALRLAEGRSLRLGDVLALERAPRRVVLSSCESARGGAGSPHRRGEESGPPVATLGLAQAFLVAGSETVVASLRPVGDRDTESLFRRVYSNPGSLAERMRAAQLAWRAEDSAADWQSFRIFVP